VIMPTIRYETEKKVCQRLWETLIPQETIADLWEIRDCFNKYYQNDLFFIVVEEEDAIVGFLPLSYIKENDYYGYFPGETWKGLTWIEQNRLIALDKNIFDQILRFLSDKKLRYHLRYLINHPLFSEQTVAIDEIGYLFYPPEVSYKIENYYTTFKSKKSLKSIRKEIRAFEQKRIEYRVNHTPDFDLMIQMNYNQFLENSYFADSRFRSGFKDLRQYFSKKNWLQIITVLIEGRPAAIDFGCIYQNHYTLLAGATNKEFLGIAKLINLYHMKKGCDEKLESIDFLCGDFSWKKIFHLTPRPLYKITNSDL